MKRKNRREEKETIKTSHVAAINREKKRNRERVTYDVVQGIEVRENKQTRITMHFV